MRLKIIDRYVIKSFISPFILWTLIALFVLLLQMMWVYIDEIMGKGAGLFFITEMIFYLSVFLVPQALLVGVLTSSVMVVGAMAEHYELSSMKSAGVSLVRVMRPLLIFCTFITAFSFICSNYLSPLAKLKYNARLYDIRRQKPALAIEEGVFTDNFPGYTIRIGRKNSDGRRISDVMIYQTSRQAAGGSFTLSEVIAKNGEMYTSEDEQLMIMELNDGHRYEKAGSDDAHRFGFMRTSFKSWQKIFEVTELDRTDERLFGNNQATKTLNRLKTDIDSIGNYLREQKAVFGKNYTNNFTLLNEVKQDTTTKINTPTPLVVEINKPNKKKLIEIPSPTETAGTTPSDNTQQLTAQTNTNLSEMRSVLQTFPVYHRAIMINKAKTVVENIITQAASNGKSFDKIRETQAKHISEYNSKFLMSVMCIVFVLIGAPMGAIVRKGGFGYSVLVSISMFIVFIFLVIMFRKLGDQGTINAWIAIWIPCFILTAIGSYLTWHATRDTRVFNPDRFRWLTKPVKWLLLKATKISFFTKKNRTIPN